MPSVKINPINNRMATCKKYLRYLISFLLTLFLVSMMMDFLRKPVVPNQADSVLLRDLQQQPFFLAQLSQTQPAVLYFWGSWCGYCQYTSPVVNRLAQEGIPVVSVALRSGQTDTVQAYLTENQYQFTTINDPQGMMSAQWQVQVTPTIIILHQGKMVFATTGLTSYWGIKVRLFLATFF